MTSLEPPVPATEPEPGPANVGGPAQGIPPEMLGADGAIVPTALAQIVPSAQAWSTQRMPDGTWFVVQRIESLNGSFLFGYPVDHARKMGEDLIAIADAHPNTGLILPTGPAIPPDLLDGVGVHRH